MKPRAVILALLLAGSLAWVHLEQRQGRFQEAAQWFLDFLVANAQDALAAGAPAESPDVVLVEFREEDKAEFSAWPPAALDFIMVLKRLAEHQPEVVAVVEPLRWEQVDPVFLAQLRQALIPFTVVLGFELSAEGSGMTQALADFATREMPVLPGADGSSESVPRFHRVVAVPDGSLRMAAQTGFSALHGGSGPEEARVPLVAGDGRRLVPSLAAQAAMLFRHVPYAALRLRFGTGARLSMGDEFIVPLDETGALMLQDKPLVPRVNALDLMTPDLGDDHGRSVQAMLGRQKVVILSQSPSGMRHARAVASALAVPQVHRASAAVEWSFAAVACLLCFWQLRQSRMKALMIGNGAVVAGMMVCLLVFQSSFAWWSPLAALVALSVGTVFCIVWPYRSPENNTEPRPDPA